MILFYHETDKIKATLEGRGFRPKFFGKLCTQNLGGIAIAMPSSSIQLGCHGRRSWGSER
jgi:hypothetical protein